MLTRPLANPPKVGLPKKSIYLDNSCGVLIERVLLQVHEAAL
jgi:hypothetical protein